MLITARKCEPHGCFHKISDDEIAGSGNATYEDVRRGLQMLASGQIRAQVGHVLPLPRAAEAHALLEGRGVVGRVVLRGW